VFTSEYIRGKVFVEGRKKPFLKIPYMNSNAMWQSKIERDKNGAFTQKHYGEKKLRSMKLTDYAWNKLEAIAQASDISRTDVVENFTREEVNEQEIILKALDKFIESKQADWGNNPSQKGDFNPNSRT
jgi:hypothetical protein